MSGVTRRCLLGGLLWINFTKAGVHLFLGLFPVLNLLKKAIKSEKTREKTGAYRTSTILYMD